MARHFTRASVESITFDPGALAGFVGGPSTFVVLWRATTVAKGTIADCRTAADYVVASWRTESTGREWYAYNGATNFAQAQTYSASTWRIDAFTKGAGNSIVRAHYAMIGGGWTHADYSAKTDSATSISKVVVGNGTLLGALDGDIAAMMIVRRVLTDGETETLWSGLSAWDTAIGATQAALWAFNQTDVADPVTDLTGGGADQVSIVGTSVTGDPPGWSYSLGVTGTAAVSLGSLGVAAVGVRGVSGTAMVDIGAMALSAVGGRPYPGLLTADCGVPALSPGGSVSSLSAAASVSVLTAGGVT